MTAASRRLMLGAVLVVVLVVVAVTALVLRRGSDDAPSADRPGTRTCAAPNAAQTALAGRPVTRSDGRLLLDGSTWDASGVNLFWLGLADGSTYPSHGEIADGLAAAKQLGAHLVRSTTLGVSVGSPESLEPRLDVFNDTAFDTIDYAVAQARRCGLRLMIPLTDQHHYYHGGKHTFTNWFGHPDIPGASLSDPAQKAAEAAFYDDQNVIDAFHRYVTHLLDHVNPLTGVRLGDDPTIAIWETGNELYDAPSSWTQQTAQFIRTLAPKALIADGSASTGADITRGGVDQPDVDIVDAHSYPRNADTSIADAAYVTAKKKVYLVGEYPLTGTGLAAWLSRTRADENIAGALAWSLLPYDGGGHPVPHDDGYTFHYPGSTDAEVRQTELLRTRP